METKYRSKQANIDMQRKQSKTLNIGLGERSRPRPQDLDLHPTKRAKTQERET